RSVSTPPASSLVMAVGGFAVVFMGTSPGTAAVLGDRSTTAALWSRCADVGETLAAVSSGPVLQVAASSSAYRARVAGLGETPSCSRRQSLSWLYTPSASARL